LLPQYTTEGEKGSHSRAVGTTVHYRGRKRYTLEGCWYQGTLQRERKVHTQGLLVPQYTTEGEKGSHSRAVGTTVHYRGRERFTFNDCEYNSTLQRERKVHTQGL
jgi:dUTPase